MSETKWLAVVAALAILGVGCSGAATDGETEGGTSTAQAPTSGTEPDDGSVVADNPDHGVLEGEIRIGWMGDTTGPTAATQTMNLEGTEAFIEYLNEQGGVLGRELVLTVMDDQFDAEQGVSNFKRLVNDENVLAILQMGGAHITSALAPDIERIGIPVVGLNQTIDVQTETSYFFNNMPNYENQAAIAVQRLADRVGDVADLKVVVPHLTVPSGEEFAGYVEETVESLGGQYGGSLPMAADQLDATNLIVQLEQMAEQDGVNAVALHTSPNTAVQVLDAMGKQSLELPVVGIHAATDLSIYRQVSAETTELLEAMHGFLPGNAECEGCREMMEVVSGTDGEELALNPDFSRGWVNSMILTDAIQRAAESGELDRESLYEALTGRFDAKGMTCDVDWTERNYSPCVTVLEWGGEGLVATNDFDYWKSFLSQE